MSLPGEIRAQIWRAVLPHREYFEVDVRDAAKPIRRQQPSEYYGLFLSCYQTYVETRIYPIDRSLEVTQSPASPRTLRGTLGDTVDELIYTPVLPIPLGGFRGKLDWMVKDILECIACEIMTFREIYAIASFDRFGMVYLTEQAEHGHMTRRRSYLHTQAIYKVEGLRMAVKRFHRRTNSDLNAEGREIMAEIATLRERGFAAQLKGLFEPYACPP
jgi:hypothetical protein